MATGALPEVLVLAPNLLHVLKKEEWTERKTEGERERQT
jgi:hypothetical protein